MWWDGGMTEPALMRPPRVTTACLFMGLTCAILLFMIGSMLSNWGSIEVQDQVRKALADEPLKGSGLSVAEVMGWLRWALMGAAAVISTGIVFAVYTARGHQASRIILTVMCGLSALVFLAGGLFGVLPGAFSIGCGIYLWTADSRRWFAIKNGKAVAPVVAPAPVADLPSSVAPVVASQAPADDAPAHRLPRPGSILGAGLTALIMSALVAFVCGVNALGYVLAKDEYVRVITEHAMMKDVVRQAGMTPAAFAHVVFVGCLIAAVVALLAVAAAGATLAGNRAGHIALLGLTILTLPVSVAVFPVGLVWTAAAVAVLVLLRRPESREWLGRRRTQ